MTIKVLIIDDSALVRRILTEIVRSQPDMEVVGVAPDPLVARELIKQTNPDVLTLDVEMPGLDGFEVAAAIRASHGAGFPVVLVTGRSDPAFIAQAQALSADYIAKPVNWPSLAGLLRAMLGAVHC